ncbi:cobalamin-independent methionine synthase II family protein [Caldivirga maquilingensis]|uniref:Methionine synthase vitamin-B12 independent n=1 Tax=Caldivirga maquilingensis (strain ATCC 700844 / DSM 13496 / JCM 10307 / IC-167) TaxID=397948 RepID=A8MCC0_CALMQ|nr:cobalamin-independent methionine synthase II family protein [Caldivirga maquilingensis]ABW01426.1 Methionine synthase vitamin-B12 independent [Caldivirga maquilingensis IC-167]
MSDLFATSVVGSWPRPRWLLDALKRRNKGELSIDDFNKIADEAVLLAIKYQEDAGIDVITDGEQRRDNFYSFVVDKLNGVKLMSAAELLDYVENKEMFENVLRAQDVPSTSIRNPVAVDKVSLKRPLVSDEALFLKEHTRSRIKVTIPGPYLLTRSMWVKALSGGVYPTRYDLAKDITKILREEIIRLRDLGVDFIQLDEPTLMEVLYGKYGVGSTFMCAVLAARMDPTEELEFAVNLINETIKGIDGVRLGIHVCRGNWTKNEKALLSGDYRPLLPYLMETKVKQLVLEFSTPRAGDVDVLRDYANEKEIGLGVVNPRSDVVESEDFVIERVKRVIKFQDAGKVWLNPDCGFGTFAEVPLVNSEIAYRKLRIMVNAAKKLRQEFTGK